VAASAQEALTYVREDEPDLILLDWTLPDFSGLEVCRRMRASGIKTPVLMLTARDDIPERVEALDAGADDYLTKPFSIEELLARVRARLRRDTLNPQGEEADEVLSLADITMNTATREVQRNGRSISLTVREYDLLHTLLKEPNRVHERQDLLHAVWGENHYGDSNLLDVYIRYLRKKIEDPELPTLVQTVRGVGFMLKETPRS
jgi:two-component system response regulator MprA